MYLGCEGYAGGEDGVAVAFEMAGDSAEVIVLVGLAKESAQPRLEERPVKRIEGHNAVGEDDRKTYGAHSLDV